MSGETCPGKPAVSGGEVTGDALSRLLLNEASHGRLMEWLASPERSEDQTRAAVERLAAMHHEGAIDLLEHLGRPEGVEEWQLDYGAWCAVYRTLLPLIEEVPRRVILSVERLATGLWEWTLREAFVEWCARDRARVDGVLVLHGDIDVPTPAIAGALIAGMRSDPAAHVATAIAYVHCGRLRMSGTRGMACMAASNPQAVALALGALGGLARDGFQPIADRAGALCAALELAHRCGGYADTAVSGMVLEAVSTGVPEFRRECCLAVSRFGKEVGEGLLTALLDAVARLDVAQAENRTIADMAFYGLFSGKFEQQALPPLEAILRAGSASSPFAGLKSTAHLIAHDPALLARVVYRWLLAGEGALCAAARHLLMVNGDRRLAFDLDPGNADWPAGVAAYAAGKAIGWLMVHATAPASFIVRLFPGVVPEEADVLAGLLSDPILVNYPVAARAYLDGVASLLPEPSASRIRGVLAGHDAYVAAIEAVGYVPELQPTERQRWIERQRRAEEWKRSSAEAESESELLGMFGRQTILHGVTVICYVDDPGGEPRRLENRMGTVSYTSDNAMAGTYDPCELDYMLRAFRAERPPG